jgi:hypothetical protein
MELRAARRERRGAIGLGWKLVRKAVRRVAARAAARVVQARVGDGGGGMGAIVRGVDARRCLRVVVRVVEKFAARDVRMDVRRLA